MDKGERDVCFSVSDEMYAKLVRIAEFEGKDVQEVINEAAAEFLAEIERNPEILKTLAADLVEFENRFQVENHIN